MAAVIDSAPDCVTRAEGMEPPDDVDDFVLQANYEDCAGFGTFMPGSTYGDEGAAAETAYYVLVGLGIAVTVAALIAWVVFENRQLIRHAAELGLRRVGGEGSGGAEPSIGPTRK
jgi:hypothetical protein